MKAMWQQHLRFICILLCYLQPVFKYTVTLSHCATHCVLVIWQTLGQALYIQSHLEMRILRLINIKRLHKIIELTTRNKIRAESRISTLTIILYHFCYKHTYPKTIIFSTGSKIFLSQWLSRTKSRKSFQTNIQFILLVQCIQNYQKCIM